MRRPSRFWIPIIPSLGTREVFTFGSGVALPTRMRFTELPAALRPNSEAAGYARSDGGKDVSRDLISSVIERWRSASMSHKVGTDDDLLDYGSPLDAPLQPAIPQAPVTPPASPRGEALRASILKKPLDAGAASPYPLPNNPVGYPTRQR